MSGAARDTLGRLEAATLDELMAAFPAEWRVFGTPSVELYVAVTTRHRFAAGDWTSYEEQKTFEWGEDEALSRLVLPPELDPAVLVFRRR
jgi:hypothetical protein